MPFPGASIHVTPLPPLGRCAHEGDEVAHSISCFTSRLFLLTETPQSLRGGLCLCSRPHATVTLTRSGGHCTQCALGSVGKSIPTSSCVLNVVVVKKLGSSETFYFPIFLNVITGISQPGINGSLGNGLNVL